MTAHNRSGRPSVAWIRLRRRNIRLQGEDVHVEDCGTTERLSWKMMEKQRSDVLVTEIRLNCRIIVLQLRVYRLQQSGGGGSGEVLRQRFQSSQP